MASRTTFRPRPVAHSSILRIGALLVGVLGSVLIARLGGAEVKGISSAFAGANSVIFAVINIDLAHQALRRARENDSTAGISSAMARAWVGYCAVGVIALAVLLIAGLPFEWFVLGAVACVIGGQAGVIVSGIAGPVVVAWGAITQQAAIALGTVVLHLMGALNGDTIRLVVVIAYLAPFALFVRPLLSVSTGEGSRMRVRELVTAGVPWQLARLPQTLLLKLDVIVVFLVLGTAAAGIYSIGLSLAMLCTIVPAQFASNALFDATRNADAGSGGRTQRDKTVLRSALAGLAAAVLLAALGWPALWVLYGHEFMDAYPVMLACLVGAVSYGVIQVQSNHVRILGEARHLALANGIGLATMLLGFLLLIPAWGAAGAGAAFSLGCLGTAVIAYTLRSKIESS
jgi:O-antigen/teichoic acid export membrane protein